MRTTTRLIILLMGGLTTSSVFGQTSEKRFWTWFQAHDDALFAVATGREPICDELASQLHKIHPDLTFEFGPVRSGRREFVLSAGGIREAFPAVISLFKSASPLDRWTIIPFRPARPDLTVVEIDGVKVDVRSVQFLAQSRGPLTDLEISVPGFKATPTRAYEQAAFLLLDHLLGEYSVEMRIGTIEIVGSESRPAGEWLSLTRLSEFVKTESPK